MLPKVSIVTPVYNSETYIAKTIESVLRQTYTNWEMIIVDDKSTDTSAQIVQAFKAQDSRIQFFQLEKNSGAAIARNKATEIAAGQFIAFLDADDLWYPDKLERQIKLMRDNKLDVCFSSYELIEENGARLNKVVNALPALHYETLLKSNYIGNLTGIYNANTIGKIIVPNLKKRQDWLLWLMALDKSQKPALSIAQPLAQYRIRDNSISSSKLGLIKYNYWVYRRGLGFSSLKSIYYMLVFLKEHFFIKSKQIRIIN